MDKESIRKRREDLVGGVAELEKMIVYLSEQLEERQRNLIATNAAIAECDYWLGQLAIEQGLMIREPKIFSDDPTLAYPNNQ